MLFFRWGKYGADGDSFIRTHWGRILTCVPVAQKLRRSRHLSVKIKCAENGVPAGHHFDERAISPEIMSR